MSATKPPQGYRSKRQTGVVEKSSCKFLRIETSRTANSRSWNLSPITKSATTRVIHYLCRPALLIWQWRWTGQIHLQLSGLPLCQQWALVLRKSTRIWWANRKPHFTKGPRHKLLWRRVLMHSSNSNYKCLRRKTLRGPTGISIAVTRNNNCPSD